MTYDAKKWCANTSQEEMRDGRIRYRAWVAHWNGHDWRSVWEHSDVKNSRTAARNVAIKKIHELEASGYQRPASA